MKHFVLLFLLLPLSSCKKDKKEVPETVQLYGKWKFINSKGGFNGTDVVTSPTGTIKYLVLKESFEYQMVNNNQVEKTGKYDLSSGQSNLSKKTSDFIHFDNDGFKRTYVRMGDTLMINDDHPEGYGSLYIKSN